MLHADPEWFTGDPAVEPEAADIRAGAARKARKARKARELETGLPPRPVPQLPGVDPASRGRPGPTPPQHSAARIDMLSQEIAALREDLEALKGST